MTCSVITNDTFVGTLNDVTVVGGLVGTQDDDSIGVIVQPCM